MTTEINTDAMMRAVSACTVPVFRGSVSAADNLAIHGVLPGARVGMQARVFPRGGSAIAAEVVACDGASVTLFGLELAVGVGPGDRIETAPLPHHIPCGREMLGRVVNPCGLPIDDGPRIIGTEPFSLERPAPNPLTRPPVVKQLQTGIRVIDGCLGIGEGQRIGLFAGPGLGKSTLIGMLAGQALSDVNVICLVGERGREVGAFLRESLGPEGLKRSVVVLATADASPMARIRALDAATTIAEWFRDQGCNVLMLVDSLTRVVRARRELGLALGEAPARGGYPASAFSSLAGLIERTGNGLTGSITAVYTVLTEERADDPVAEEARSLLDGHIVLSAKQARAGIWPAVDVVRSVSRVFEDIAPNDVVAAGSALKQMLAAYEENEDLILMGAYRRGASSDTDRALDRQKDIKSFLGQARGEISDLPETFGTLKRLVDIE